MRHAAGWKRGALIVLAVAAASCERKYTVQDFNCGPLKLRLEQTFHRSWRSVSSDGGIRWSATDETPGRYSCAYSHKCNSHKRL